MVYALLCMVNKSALNMYCWNSVFIKRIMRFVVLLAIVLLSVKTYELDSKLCSYNLMFKETFQTIKMEQDDLENRENLYPKYSVLKQEYFTHSNTVYIIKEDYVLAENIIIPNNCVLKFEGGSLRGPFSIMGNNTRIEAGTINIFGPDVNFAGSWNVNNWNVCWFGASVGNHDNSPYIKRALDAVYSLGTKITDGYGFNDCGVFIPSGVFKLASKVEVDSRFNLYGNGSSSVLYSTCPDNLFVVKGIRATISLNNINFICDDSVRTKCNCISLETDQGTALGRITNCDFVNFNIALNLNTPYWTRITSCNFVYTNEYAVKAKNANSFSLINCNFRGLDGSYSPACHLFFTGDMQGVCITGCDFSGAYRASIKLENAKGYGIQITGNYFEPGYKSVYWGGLIEADKCNITDLLFRANAAYESKAFDIYENNIPRYYLLLKNTWLYRSDVVGNVIIDGTINGDSNSLVGRIYKYSDFQKGNQNLIDSYFTQVEKVKLTKINSSTNSSTRALDQFRDEIQKRMSDNSIITNAITNKKNNITTVFSRIIDVENNVEYSGGVINKGGVKSGPYKKRPLPAEIFDGYQYFNTDTHKTITWAEGKWWNPDGTEATK